MCFLYETDLVMKRQNYIDRPSYLKQLWSWKEQPVIKVIVGPRRGGKTTLFRLFQQQLKESGIEEKQIISLNLEDPRLIEYTDPSFLYNTLYKKLSSKNYYYLFIDEIQECRNFEKAINGLALLDNVDIYIAGSNAHILSGELATYLSGRYVCIEMMPLSFSEFRSAVAADRFSVQKDFRRYLEIGSFPAVVALRDDPLKITTYYASLIDTIIEKDVRTRYEVRNSPLLRRVIEKVASSVGSPVSARKMTDILRNNKVDVSNSTVTLFLRALEEAYFCYKVQRFDLRGNVALTSEEKFYLCDPGLRQNLVNTTVSDLGHLLENVVYLELRRRFAKVSIGKAGSNEIGFVARTKNDIRYFQVCTSVLDESTLAREVKAFSSVKDNYPRYLLTLDEVWKNQNIQGIRQVNAIDWLLEEKS